MFTWLGWDGSVDRVQARARSAAGALSAIQTLSPAGQEAYGAEVAVDADGDAVFAWENRYNGRIQARARSKAGVLSAVQTLSPAGASQPRVAVDADGDAVFTWTNSLTDRVQTRARSKAGVLSAVQNIYAGANIDFLTQPKVAVDADGDAVFTWWHNRVVARARSAGGALSAVQVISCPPCVNSSDSHPEVAVDADGDAVFTWSRYTDSARIMARARSKTGVLSAVKALSSAGQAASFPQVAVDTDGDAVFTWSHLDGSSCCDRIQARARSKAGALSAVQTLSGQNAGVPEVAVDADGDAVFTWSIHVGTRDRVQARARSKTGVLSAVQTLSFPASASGPEVAVDADGDAVVAWQQLWGSPSRFRVAAAFGP